MSARAMETWEDTRPGWPKAVGILSLVFGLLAVTCGTAGLAMPPMMAGFMGFGPDVPPPPNMSLNPEYIGTGVVNLVINLVLVVAGIALLRRKMMGRTLHLVYALLAVIGVGINSFLSMRMQAGLQTWLEQYGSLKSETTQQTYEEMFAGGQAMAIPGLIFGIVLGLAWPVFCMIWFGVIKTDRASMVGDSDDLEALSSS